MCHVLCVKYHISYIFFDKVLGLVDGGYVFKGAYPVYYHYITAKVKRS